MSHFFKDTAPERAESLHRSAGQFPKVMVKNRPMKNKVDKIGFWSVFALVVGSQVGSGIFLLPASLASLGTLGLFGWGITGIGAILLALVFSKLCSHAPHNGGPHVYVLEAFGTQAGFFTAWTYWLISWISSIALVITIAGSLASIFGFLNPFNHLLLEGLVLCLILILNLRGLQLAGRSEIILSTLKLIPLLLIPAYGLFFLNTDHFFPFTCANGDVGGTLNNAALLTLWGFIGLETATAPAESVENPRKTIPRALILGTTLVAVLYIFNTIVIMGLIPGDVLCQTASPYALAAQLLWGPGWDFLISGLIALVCFGALNAWILTSGQIAYGAAENGLFPPLFLKKNTQDSPIWGILLSGIGMVPFLILLMEKKFIHKINVIIDLSATAFLLLYALCVLAFLKLMWQKRMAPFFGMWLLGGSALVFCVWTLWAAGLKMIGLSFFIPLSGLLLKIFWRFQRKSSSNQ